MTTLGLVGFLPTRVEAEPPPELMNFVLQTREQTAKVVQGETVAMVCGKCKTVVLSKVDKKKGFLGWFQAGTKHECPGCGGTFSMKDLPAGQRGQVVGAGIRSHLQQVR